MLSTIDFGVGTTPLEAATSGSSTISICESLPIIILLPKYFSYI
jgi:hypothetical protein